MRYIITNVLLYKAKRNAEARERLVPSENSKASVEKENK